MRPYLADLLNRWSGTSLFTYILPNYVILLSLGALVGTIDAARRARRRGLDPDPVYGLILWAFPAALVAARLLHVLRSPGTYEGSVLSMLDPLRGSSIAYGGFLGGVGTAIAYLLLRRLAVWRYLDCAAPSLGIATAFTRCGCFLDGCDFGVLSDSPIAVRFPAGSPAHAAQVEWGLIAPAASESLPVIPVQLFLALKGVFVAVAVALYLRHRRAAPGEAFFLFWVLYASTRFGVEFFRGDPTRGFLGPLTLSQVISLPVLAAALGLFAWRRSRRAATA